MIRQTLETDQFKQKLSNSLIKEMSTNQPIKIAKHSTVYATGDKGDLVYLIETGQVKLLLLSPEGKECILAIHSLGDIFGEFCIGDLKERAETAIAMTDIQLKAVSSAKFLVHLGKESLLEGFVQYLSGRVVEQQHVIAGLIVVDSEERLGNLLLELARSCGKQDPRSIRIELIVSHQELAAMIGTTPSIISLFMQNFHNLGLIETTEQDHTIVKERKLVDYLACLITHLKKPPSM